MYGGLFNDAYFPNDRDLDTISDPVNHLGPDFCYVMSSLFLNGIIIVQTYKYVEQSGQDVLYLQIFVYSIFVLCTGKSIYSIYSTWRIFAPDFGDYEALYYQPSIGISLLLGSFIGFLVQSYFILRMFLLSKSRLFLAASLLVALSGLAGTIALCLILDTPGLNDTAQTEMTAGYVMMIGTAVTDALITGFTCWYFFQQRQASPFPRTKELLTRLIAIAMESAAPSFVCAIANLMFNTQLYRSDGEWVRLFGSLMPYFFVISLLFTLNSRVNYRTIWESQGDQLGFKALDSTLSDPSITKCPNSVLSIEDTKKDAS